MTKDQKLRLAAGVLDAFLEHLDNVDGDEERAKALTLAEFSEALDYDELAAEEGR